MQSWSALSPVDFCSCGAASGSLKWAARALRDVSALPFRHHSCAEPGVGSCKLQAAHPLISTFRYLFLQGIDRWTREICRHACRRWMLAQIHQVVRWVLNQLVFATARHSAARYSPDDSVARCVQFLMVRSTPRP